MSFNEVTSLHSITLRPKPLDEATSNPFRQWDCSPGHHRTSNFMYFTLKCFFFFPQGSCKEMSHFVSENKCFKADPWESFKLHWTLKEFSTFRERKKKSPILRKQNTNKTLGSNTNRIDSWALWKNRSLAPFFQNCNRYFTTVITC